MKNILLSFFLIVFTIGYAQVGINTTTPSNAAVLHLESLNSAGTYGGFMPPVVNQSQRDAIDLILTPTDDGMMIYFVEGTTRCVQIYQASTTNWVDMYCMPIPSSFTEFAQDFDSNINWTYSVNPALYTVGTDKWDIMTSLSSISNVSNNFLGCQDLNNGNGGGNFFHEIATFKVLTQQIVVVN